MWVFRSAIGPIYIKRLSDGMYVTEYNGVDYEKSDDPEALAANVYTQTTGCCEWDNRHALFEDVPRDLSEWERV